MLSELGEVLPNERNLGLPAFDIHIQQLLHGVGGNVQTLGVDVLGGWQPSDGSIHGLRVSVDAFEDPLQDAAVLAVAGPEELAVFIGAEPVHVINLWQLRALMFPDLEVVSEIVAHVVAAEGKHRHRIAAELSDLAGRRRGGLAARGSAQEGSMLPIERLCDQRYDARATSSEQDGVNRHALWVFPLR